MNKNDLICLRIEKNWSTVYIYKFVCFTSKKIKYFICHGNIYQPCFVELRDS